MEQLVEEELPVLWAHFKKYSWDLSLLTNKWFLSLFIGFLPHDTVFVVSLLPIHAFDEQISFSQLDLMGSQIYI